MYPGRKCPDDQNLLSIVQLPKTQIRENNANMVGYYQLLNLGGRDRPT